MIALQYWFDFFRTSTGMNCGCTCVPSLLNLLLISRPFPPRTPGYHRTLSLKEPGCFACVMFISWNSPIPFSRLLDGLVAIRPDFSETTFYLHLLFQRFFFLFTKFLSSVDPKFLLRVIKSEAAYCKLQKRNEVVDLIPDKSVFLIRGDLLWGPKSSHCQILHVSWCMETVYTCVSNCLLRTCITYMIHKHIDM